MNDWFNLAGFLVLAQTGHDAEKSAVIGFYQPAGAPMYFENTHDPRYRAMVDAAFAAHLGADRLLPIRDWVGLEKRPTAGRPKGTASRSTS